MNTTPQAMSAHVIRRVEQHDDAAGSKTIRAMVRSAGSEIVQWRRLIPLPDADARRSAARVAADAVHLARGPRRRRAAHPAARRNAAAAPGAAGSEARDRLQHRVCARLAHACVRCPVIAKRCASSRTRWIRCSAGESGGSIEARSMARQERRSCPAGGRRLWRRRRPPEPSSSSSASDARSPVRAGPCRRR